MPELPEVEHICRYLRSRLAGRTIRAVTHLDWPKGLRGTTPAAFRRTLAGARIARVDRRAKLVLIELADGRTLVIHLKMTGKLWVVKGARPKDRSTRAIFALDPTHGARRRRGDELRFEDQRKFGWMAILSPEERGRALAPFGPDALEASEAELATAYAGRRRRAKPLLLDQTAVAGIGNIYADEILFEARVHPAARLDALPAAVIRRLARATRAVMACAVARREGVDVPDQKRVGGGGRGIAERLGPKVYQRTGEPCVRCGAPVERIVLGGRATHMCPQCQPARPTPHARSWPSQRSKCRGSQGSGSAMWTRRSRGTDHSP